MRPMPSLQAMAGEKAEQCPAGAGIAGILAHEQIFQEHQPLEIDAGMRDRHRGQARNLAVGEGEREMRIGRAFIAKPFSRGGRRPAVIERRLPVVRRHLAKHSGKRFGIVGRRPADVDRHRISQGTWR